MLEWYRSLKYDVSIQDHAQTVEASRGLKQGCLIAPLPWSLVTGRLLYRLALVTDVTWASQNVTMLPLRLITSRICRRQRNFSASCSSYCYSLGWSEILQICSTFQVQRWIRETLVTATHLPVPRRTTFPIRTDSGRLFEFPVVDSHTYLGTKISYQDPQLQTLMYRMGLAKVEWSRLRKLVCSRHGLFKQDRLRIWYSSIPPTLMYGLAATGLPAAGGRQIRALYMRHLRAILRCSAHLSHTSNREVLAQAKLPDICALLEKEMIRLAQNAQQLAW